MNEDWRILLYPLGFTGGILFSLRFLHQWIRSEVKKESHVTKLFWWISFAGSLCMVIHSTVQIQYNVAIIQTSNAIISWRNLNLMGKPEKKWTTSSTIWLMAGGLFFVTLLFLLQSLSLGELTWIRSPTTPWMHKPAEQYGYLWHLFGTCSLALFATRFWIQWWQVERDGHSHFSGLFWWFSLIGSALSFLYFSLLLDVVNMLGYSLGLIPYIRNLMLMHQTKKNKLQDLSNK